MCVQRDTKHLTRITSLGSSSLKRTSDEVLGSDEGSARAHLHNNRRSILRLVASERQPNMSMVKLLDSNDDLICSCGATLGPPVHQPKAKHMFVVGSSSHNDNDDQQCVDLFKPKNDNYYNHYSIHVHSAFNQ